MKDLDRRDFLKTMGIAGASAVFEPGKRYFEMLVPQVVPPEDLEPGQATWYATTCRECPAGCGMHVKNRDGRIIKAEGNPNSPISFGNLCPRGQASLQGLYNPDRLRAPARKGGSGRFEPVSWEDAEKLVLEKLDELNRKGRGSRIALITELETGALNDLARGFMSLSGSTYIPYEPFAYEALRSANKIVFNDDSIPNYRIDKADFLVSFNAGFLETWISNVEHAHYFQIFHEPDVHGHGLNPFFFVGPRNSLTAANADTWIKVRPGDEYLIALGMLRVILDESLAHDLSDPLKGAIEQSLAGFSLDSIAKSSGVDREEIQDLARKFAQAKRPLAVSEGQGSPNALETSVATNLLCSLFPGTAELMDFNSPSALSDTARASDMKELSQRMEGGDIDLILIHRANPAFSLPASWKFAGNLEKVPMIVSFSSWIDETSAHAHVLLPAHTPLESWGEYSPRKNVLGLMQPAMGQLFQTRLLGDILLSMAKKHDKEGKFAQKDFHEMLMDSWRKRWKASGSGKAFNLFWLETVQAGGWWEKGGKQEQNNLSAQSFSSFKFPAPQPAVASLDKKLLFVSYPTIQFFDGRMANRPWMQELPDPIAQAAWGGWAEINPATATKLGIRKGELLRIKSDHGEIEAPALPLYSVLPDVIAIPIGQGHTDYGRYATGLPANPMGLMPNSIDKRTGGLQRPSIAVSLIKSGNRFDVVTTDGSYYQHHRKLIQRVSIEDYKKDKQSGAKPDVDEPLPRGYKIKEDFYPPRYPVGYRWAMVLDLHRCIGCGACSVACYAENNLAVVGREEMLLGREMSWLTVQRYFDEKHPEKIEFLVMLCQHCTEAPCEAVCPVFAPQHSVEGLNAQIYNRCIGTRDCSQNDPWKVRRFNFSWYKHPFPLDRQLNPDVTVRQVGVMEKCSFCVQRIIEAKAKARNEGRKVKDGEFTTACAQTCPTNALTFGSLLDPESRVSKLIKDPRAYQTLKHLNTKPAAIYLKRITKET